MIELRKAKEELLYFIFLNYFLNVIKGVFIYGWYNNSKKCTFVRYESFYYIS